MNLSKRQAAYVDAIIKYADDLGIDCSKDTFTRAELRQVSMHYKGKKWIPNWITHDQSRRSGRGMFNITEVSEIWRSMNEDSKPESSLDDILEPVMA